MVGRSLGTQRSHARAPASEPVDDQPIRLEATRGVIAARGPETDLVVAGRTLARQGYRFVVLHEDLVPSSSSCR